jgi:arylsulfatase A-like enzyme
MSKAFNVLLITTDQQQKKTLGCYGNPYIQTPNLDHLSEEGVLFNRAYAECPVCMPSRVTMVTGRSARFHGTGVHNSSMRSDEPVLGDVLQTKGYQTYFVGKPHFKSQQHRDTEESIADWRDGKMADWHGPYAGFQRADILLGHSNPLLGHYGEWLKKEHPDAWRHFTDKEVQPLDVTSGNGTYKNNIPEEAYSSTYIGNQVCDYLDEVKDSNKPFYCFASFPDPHWPIMPPEPYFSMYDNVTIPEPIAYNDEAEKDNYPQHFNALRQKNDNAYDGGGHYMQDCNDALKITRPYWGAITLIDKNIGRMLDKLKENNQYENTLIIFTTDHGEYMGAHGMMAKGGSLWEEFINVPFIVKAPNSAKGLKTQALLSMTDVVPTILDYLAIKEEETTLSTDGISQKDVIDNTKERVRSLTTVFHPTNRLQKNITVSLDDDELLSHKVYPDQHALITDKYKLVYYAGEKNGLLFDLENDPNEQKNLYNLTDYRDVQNKLITRLLNQLIFESDKQPIVKKQGADEYGRHLMTYDMWGKEFRALEKGSH